MAIYEYTCAQCGHHFEARRSMKDADAPIGCPACGGQESRRGLSLFFAASSSGPLKGSGSGCSSCSGGGGHSCASCSGH